jgi:hypothetical protein
MGHMAPFTTKVRVEQLAAKQGGRLRREQLTHLGLSRDLIRSWVRRQLLIPVRPMVYALGYVRTDLVALTWEAVLYAGPGAYLTGAGGCHHLDLIDYPPRELKVATPWRRRSLPGIIVLSNRPELRELHHGVPVAPTAELMLELAAEGDYNVVRKALSNLEYRRQLDVAALLAVCSRGRRGAVLLRRALAHRLPQLAYARSPLEVAFLLLLEAHHLPLPRLNVRLHGILVDAYWAELGLVVELDGRGNHGTAAQKRRDAGYMETLRHHGLTVRRFDSHDVHARVPATLAALAEVGVVRGRRDPWSACPRSL